MSQELKAMLDCTKSDVRPRWWQVRRREARESEVNESCESCEEFTQHTQVHSSSEIWTWMPLQPNLPETQEC